MCGVAGCLGRVDLDDEARERILESLRHRGPDGSGAQAWPEATLLHTRLRIIDLSPAGDQPMSNEHGSVWAVFNGEIYNHRSLRQDLETRGHRFRGRSDTEVLPHLYEEYGADLFARLRGMFAVAILDRSRGRLLLGRDRFGIKPLFYAAGDRYLAFASEIGALRLVPGVDLTPDEQAISDFAALLFVPAPLTIHRGIRAVLPGELLDCSLEQDGRVEVRASTFHSFSVAPTFDLTLEEAADRAEALVDDAVVRQLESDVPLGSLLSGGIDSSLVSLFAQRSLPDDLLTFSVRLPDERYDETWVAEAVATAIGSRHRMLDMDRGGGSWDAVVALLRQAGQPFADTSIFAVDAVTRAMREHVTVALSGDGGDEGFGGYDLYWRIATIDRLQRAPAPLWLAAGRAAAGLGRAGVVRPTLGARVRDLAGADDTGILQTLNCWVREREHRELLVDGDGVAPIRRLFEPRWDHSLPPAASRLERLSAHAVEVDIRLVLPNDYLAKVDTASMRHGLEVRVPLLDEDLVAFALTLPHTLRVDGRQGKRVLRRVAARRLPAIVAKRPKHGFDVPVDRWLDPSFGPNLQDALLERNSPVADHLERSVYSSWVEAFCHGRPADGISRAGLYQRIVMLLSLDLALRDAKSGQAARVGALG